MLLRLIIQRYKLPTVKLLWNTDTTFLPTDDRIVSVLLTRVNEAIPLEYSHTGHTLESYSVEVGGFECLHFHPIDNLFKEGDEIVIRPRSSEELRFAAHAGRYQQNNAGEHIVDGKPFKTNIEVYDADRPEVFIPARKRIRASERGSSTLRIEGPPEDDNESEGSIDDKGQRGLNGRSVGNRSKSTRCSKNNTKQYESNPEDGGQMARQLEKRARRSISTSIDTSLQKKKDKIQPMLASRPLHNKKSSDSDSSSSSESNSSSHRSSVSKKRALPNRSSSSDSDSSSHRSSVSKKRASPNRSSPPDSSSSSDSGSSSDSSSSSDSRDTSSGSDQSSDGEPPEELPILERQKKLNHREKEQEPISSVIKQISSIISTVQKPDRPRATAIGTLPYQGSLSTKARNIRRRQRQVLVHLKKLNLLEQNVTRTEVHGILSKRGLSLDSDLKTLEDSLRALHQDEESLKPEEAVLKNTNVEEPAEVNKDAVTIGKRTRKTYASAKSKGQIPSEMTIKQWVAEGKPRDTTKSHDATIQSGAADANTNTPNSQNTIALSKIPPNKKWRKLRNKASTKIVFDRADDPVAETLERSATVPEDNSLEYEQEFDNDPNSWRSKMSLSAIECGKGEPYELPTPGFPFKQEQLLPNYQNKKRKRKNKKNSQPAYTNDYNKDYDQHYQQEPQYNADMYDDPVETAAPNQIEDVDEIEFPPIPANLDSLPTLVLPVVPGMIIAYKSFDMDENYNPFLTGYLRARIVKVEDVNSQKLLHVIRPVSEMPKKKLDPETGERIMGRFEMPGTADQGNIVELFFTELIEAKLIFTPEAVVNMNPNSDDGGDDNNDDQNDNGKHDNQIQDPSNDGNENGLGQENKLGREGQHNSDKNEQRNNFDKSAREPEQGTSGDVDHSHEKVAADATNDPDDIKYGQLMSIRKSLQKSFKLSSSFEDKSVSAEEMPTIVGHLETLENWPGGVPSKLIMDTNIHKVLRAIYKLKQSIPHDEEFNIRNRCQSLWRKWKTMVTKGKGIHDNASLEKRQSTGLLEEQYVAVGPLEDSPTKPVPEEPQKGREQIQDSIMVDPIDEATGLISEESALAKDVPEVIDQDINMDKNSPEVEAPPIGDTELVPESPEPREIAIEEPTEALETEDTGVGAPDADIEDALGNVPEHNSPTKEVPAVNFSTNIGIWEWGTGVDQWESLEEDSPTKASQNLNKEKVSAKAIISNEMTPPPTCSKVDTQNLEHEETDIIESPVRQLAQEASSVSEKRVAIENSPTSSERHCDYLDKDEPTIPETPINLRLLRLPISKFPETPGYPKLPQLPGSPSSSAEPEIRHASPPSAQPEILRAPSLDESEPEPPQESKPESEPEPEPEQDVETTSLHLSPQIESAIKTPPKAEQSPSKPADPIDLWASEYETDSDNIPSLKTILSQKIKPEPSPPSPPVVQSLPAIRPFSPLTMGDSELSNRRNSEDDDQATQRQILSETFNASQKSSSLTKKPSKGKQPAKPTQGVKKRKRSMGTPTSSQRTRAPSSSKASEESKGPVKTIDLTLESEQEK